MAACWNVSWPSTRSSLPDSVGLSCWPKMSPGSRRSAGRTSPSHAAQSAPLGIFRARAARRGVLAGDQPGGARAPSARINELPACPGRSVLRLSRIRAVLCRPCTRKARSRTISSTLKPTMPPPVSFRSQRGWCAMSTPPGLSSTASLEDVTTARKQEAGREALIEKLQASLLFLHEPLANLGRDVVICDTGYQHRAACRGR